MHYGILRKSGRYPWGSGGPEYASNKSFLGMVEGMRKEGMSESEIAKGLGISTTELRAAKSIAKNEEKAANIAMAQRLRDKGMSNVAIGKRMGIPEPTVRAMLAPGAKVKADVLEATSSMLKEQVAKKQFVDIGAGVEHHLGISKEKLNVAVARLKEEGYAVHNVQVDQLGTNKKTLIKVLAPPGTTYTDIVTDKSRIQQIGEFSNDGGLSFLGIKPPLSVSAKRVGVRYAEDGGTDADGVIYVRPGVKDLSLEGARYAQVRISVEGTHYLKGMAVLKDDLPPGVDLVFNTNKSNTGNKLDAMKKQKRLMADGDDPKQPDKWTGPIDLDNPFGAVVRQIADPDTKKLTSAMNIVNEEGNWDVWSRNLSSQMLSKQNPNLARTQLNMTYERKKRELEEIKKLTNPAVRKKLLEEYADGTDAAAVHLKAAALPRQATQVILPVNSLPKGEVYAPNFRNGERVALVRFPHGGIFEIPELTVNNRHAGAKKLLGNAKDAIGIHSSVAERLSGADFDGDTVLVIPNDKGLVKTAPALKGLENFDAKATYRGYPGMQKLKKSRVGFEMGDVSNLITDMSIKGANSSELARAVRHSMVVIDAEKHGLNYKQSAIDNGIRQLKEKYQSDPNNPGNKGASTLISRATSRTDVDARKLRSASAGGAVDRTTGKLVYEKTGESYVDKQGRTVVKKQRSTKLAETDDAHTLSSGTAMEKIYADHSNSMKALANQARLAAVHTKGNPVSTSAKGVYTKEVASLNAKLNLALRNAPLERQAQVVANAVVAQKKASNPDMEGAELKKIKGMALTEARLRTGAKKQRIEITESEWAAIQAGAISNHKLEQILDNADMEKVRQLATPKASTLMTPVKKSRAKAMIASGYTQAEVADALGVSLTTLKNELS